MIFNKSLFFSASFHFNKCILKLILRNSEFLLDVKVKLIYNDIV